MGDRQLWEIGGDFHWSGLPDGPFIPWPQSCTWFALGHSAALAVWRQHVSQSPDANLWVPDYFCPEVTGAWQGAEVSMHYYSDDPRWPNPDWDTLSPAPGDMVLVVNYFGVRAANQWQAWHKEHEWAILVEDHSHDPLSAWARNSKADYAFASLRKTFIVPDGALLWSPRQHPLPPEPKRRDWSGSALKLAAMIWKREYLAGCTGGETGKETFRVFQIEGERTLFEARESSISPWSHALLERGYPASWRQQRERNVRLFLDLMVGQNTISPLFASWPPEHCPFNAVLVFASESDRERARSGLIAANVYPPIHWGPLPAAPARSRELSKRILTIPLDQRYVTQDVHRVASILNDLGHGKSAREHGEPYKL